MAEMKREYRRTELRGDDWKEAVEELLEEGTKRAEAYVAAEEEYSENDVIVMRMPITFFVNFRRTGKTLADRDVGCVCSITEEPPWTICICSGTCPEDACDTGPFLKKG
jgi:hypothetical protein